MVLPPGPMSFPVPLEKLCTALESPWCGPRGGRRTCLTRSWTRPSWPSMQARCSKVSPTSLRRFHYGHSHRRVRSRCVRGPGSPCVPRRGQTLTLLSSPCSSCAGPGSLAGPHPPAAGTGCQSRPLQGPSPPPGEPENRGLAPAPSSLQPYLRSLAPTVPLPS